VDVVCDDDAQAMFEDWALFAATQAPAHKLHLFMGPPPALGDARGPSSGLSSQSGMLLCANGSAGAASPSGGSSPVGGGRAWGDAAGCGDAAAGYEVYEEEENGWEKGVLSNGVGTGGAGIGAFPPSPSTAAAAGGSDGALCASPPRVDLMALAARLEVIPPDELRVVRLLGCGGFGEARRRPPATLFLTPQLLPPPARVPRAPVLMPPRKQKLSQNKRRACHAGLPGALARLRRGGQVPEPGAAGGRRRPGRPGRRRHRGAAGRGGHAGGAASPQRAALPGGI
jgi:hypothetical protein